MGRRQLEAVLPAMLADQDLAAAVASSRMPCDPQQPWARAAMDQWGLCGGQVLDEECATVTALVCPGLQVPPSHPLQHWSKAPAGAHLLALHLVSLQDAEAATRLVVQYLVRRLAGHVDTLEALATTGEPDVLRPRDQWLCGAGFVVIDERPGSSEVRMRLEVGRAV